MKPYAFHINLYDLAALGTLFIGIGFALLLGFAKKPGQKANLFLSLALGVIVVKTGCGSAIFLPALGPLLFFYTRRLTSPGRRFHQKDLLHFCPLLAAYWMPVWLVLILVIVYLYLSYRLIQTFYDQLQPVLMDRPRFAFRQLERVLLLVGIFCLLWLFNDIFSFAVAFVLIGAAAELILKSDSDIQLSLPITDTSDAKEKGRRLKEAVAMGRLYEDAELTLATLAVKLGMHPHDLSKIVNLGLKKNFNDFINEYRVRDVIAKMKDPAYDRITLLGMAYDAGFNSKATFIRAFKQLTGKNPGIYKRGLEKEVSTYHLQPRFRSAATISCQDTTPKWSNKKLNRSHMFRNYLKIAWRNLMHNKSYAAINVTGLAIGIAACLLIFLIVQFETSFDNFHKKKDHIYRVFTVSKTSQGLNYNSGVPMPTSEGLRLDYPDILVASVFKTDKQITVPGNGVNAPKKFDEENLFFAEPQVFDVFDFGWLAGDKKTALNDPNTIVLSQSEAEKYFGDWKQAVNKTVRYENSKDLKVTGVLKNMPANTDLNLNIIVSYATLKTTNFKNGLTDWGGILSYNYCFVVLPDKMTINQFNSDLDFFVKKHKPADRVNDGMRAIALSQMHYDSNAGVYSGHTFSKELIRVLDVIGIFLLVIACVNFINLATAQAVNRSKEVGIRKVLGSRRIQIIFQFISETFIITLFAVVIGVIIAEATLPYLSHLMDIRLNTAFMEDPVVLTFLSLLIICVTLLSGFYPALILSGFNAISALKSRVFASKTNSISLRRGLVVLQFCIAQILLIGMLVITRQMDYFRNFSLGFDKDAVVNLPIPSDSISHSRLGALRNQLLSQPGINDVSYSYASPSEDGNWLMNFKYDNSTRKTDFYASLKWADAEYFKLYNLRFIAGKPYDKSDRVKGYVVNQMLLNKLGIRDPRDAIGKYINIWDDKTKYAPIIGVIKDFNVSSLKEAMLPVIIGSWSDVYGTINVKLQPGALKQTMSTVENVWNNTFPDYVYSYQFLDDKITQFYRHEEQLSSLYKIFAGIAIFISSLGLYGLVSFMAVQRTKEVGIRKTLGASVSQIVYLFSKEFTLLVLVAFAVSAPVGWYLMNKWLQGYTYKITLGPGTFVLAIIASVCIAWLTVGYRAVKAAMANPVKSLRSE